MQGRPVVTAEAILDQSIAGNMKEPSQNQQNYLPNLELTTDRESPAEPGRTIQVTYGHVNNDSCFLFYTTVFLGRLLYGTILAIDN